MRTMSESPRRYDTGSMSPKRHRSSPYGGRRTSRIQPTQVWTMPKRVVWGIALLLMPLVFTRTRELLFGPWGSIKGGLIGQMVDVATRNIVFHTRLSQRGSRLKADYGLVLPSLQGDINKRGIPTLPQSALAELLERAARHEKDIEEIKQHQKKYSIPQHVIQPNLGTWFRPLYDNDMRIVPFNEEEMARLVQTSFGDILPRWNSLRNGDDAKAVLASLCALYEYGGYWYGNTTRSAKPWIEMVRNDVTIGNGVGALALGMNNNNNKRDLVAAAVPPRHPLIGCMIHQASQSEPHMPMLLDSMLENGGDSVGSLDGTSWTEVTPRCVDKFSATCCTNLPNRKVEGSPPSIRPMSMLIKAMESNQHSPRGVAAQDCSQPRVVVTVSESPVSNASRVPKVPIATHLENANCQAGWLCNRCYKSAYYGSFPACRGVCRPCYERIVCEQQTRINVTLEVTVHETRPLQPGETKIPRIIHQTWFEDVTSDRYPQLSRLQNTWRASGWEYRFYDDNDVRTYIRKHFPPRVLEAFDSIIPGAFKVRKVARLLSCRHTNSHTSRAGGPL